MEYYYLYYIQTNLICLALLCIVLLRARTNVKTISGSQQMFSRLIVSTMALCFSDMLAGILRGKLFPGARFIIELSNWVYVVSMTCTAVVWTIYVFRRMRLTISKWKKRLLEIPFILMCILFLTNPLTHALFRIDENNLYSRGPWISMHWVVTWFYLFFSTGLLMYRYRREPSKIRRMELKPLLNFIIAPLICGLIQMFVYGVTSTQVGVTISVVMICLSNQDSLISIDELTGINNRKQLNHYIETIVDRSGGVPLLIAMIDINKFKQINDTFGHIRGDHALIQVANALKAVCEKWNRPLFLCRYGGDEFVMISFSSDAADSEALKAAVNQEVGSIILKGTEDYALSVSIGISSGVCETRKDFEHFLRLADEYMYDDKKKSNS